MDIEGREIRDTYSELAHRFESDVLKHALRLCNGDWDWAKDLTQDAFIAGYRLAEEGKLDFRGNVKAWFIRVITTRFINEYNRKKRWQSDVEIEKVDAHLTRSRLEEPLPSEDPYVSSLFDEPLEKALRLLPDEQRLCVLLIDVEELSYAEASEYLKVPIGTIRSRLARGRIRLYSLLKPYAQSRGII